MTIVLAVLACFGGAARGASAGEEQGYIGIRMDARPLPELLIKHLRLDEGQGVRIQNVGVGTPADKAGLERDDIIIGLNGKGVTDNEEFAEAAQKAGAGAEISLEIIHLGERKNVKLKLASFDKDSDFEAKFPPEPEIVQSWQPGRIFQLQPELDQWIQMEPPGGDTGAVLGRELNRIFKEVYVYHYSTDGKEYTITIEGDPDDDDTYMTIDAGDSHFKRPLKDIDKLPKEYHEAAEQAVKNARKTAASRDNKGLLNRPVLPSVPDVKIWKNLQQKQDFPGRLRAPNLERREDMYERIEKQMRQLQERIEQLEKERGKNSEYEDQKSEEKELHEQETDDTEAQEEQA